MRRTYSSTLRRMTSRAESVAKSDGREDRRPQHVAKPHADSLEQVGFVGEMAVDLGLGGAGFFGDLPDAEIRTQAIDRAKGSVDDLTPHLLAVFAPAFAARVDLHPRLLAGMRQRGSRNSDHVKHLTPVQSLTWADPL